MPNLIKKLFSTDLDEEEKKVLNAIKRSGLKTMRVVGRGTLIVDTREVTNTDKFKSYARQAKEIVEKSS